MEKWRCCLLAQLLLFHTQGMELGLGIVTILTIPRTWFFSDGFLLGSWFQSGTAIPTTSSPLDSCDEPGLVLHSLGLLVLLPVYQPYSWTVPQILIDPLSYNRSRWNNHELWGRSVDKMQSFHWKLENNFSLRAPMDGRQEQKSNGDNVGGMAVLG